MHACQEGLEIWYTNEFDPIDRKQFD